MQPEEFRAIRRHLGLNHRQLADWLGLTSNTISRLERDPGLPPARTIDPVLAQLMRAYPAAFRPARQSRSRVAPPSDAYRAAMRDLVRGGLAAGVVGFFVNLLHLGMPLYTIQVYDRVLQSRSVETLTALLVLVAAVLGSS